MALTSEDIVISSTGSWTALVVTGTKLTIAEVKRNEVMCRFDINSTSDGFKLETGDTLDTNETIYVKTPDNYAEKDAILVVVKD